MRSPPTASLPVLTEMQGAPIGIEFIDPNGDDRYLLKAATWFVANVGPATSTEA